MFRQAHYGLSVMMGLGLAWLVSGGIAAAGEASTPKRNPPILALRVHNFPALNTKVEKLLAQLNPARPIPDPLQELLGRYLHNPGLLEIAPNAFLEILLFHSPRIRASRWVVAFPITDPAEYQKTMDGQAGVQEESSTVELVTYRLDTANGLRRVYLSITSANIALFGTDKVAVMLARKEYDHHGKRGFLSKPNPAATGVVGDAPDIRLWIFLQKLLQGEAHTISEGLRTLQSDIFRDVVGDGAATTHPVARMLRTLGDELHDFLRQLSQLDGTLRLTPVGIKISARLAFVKGRALRSVMRDAPAGRLRLGYALPRESVTVSDMFLWSKWLDQIYSFGQVIQAGFGGRVGKQTRQTMVAFVEAIKAAKPIEVATAIVPPPASTPGIGSLEVKIIRWENPQRLSALYQQIESLIGVKGAAAGTLRPVRQLLERNGIPITLERQPIERWIATLPVDKFSLRIKVPGGVSWDKNGLLTKRREFFVVRRGNALIFISGDGLTRRARLAKGRATALLTAAEAHAIKLLTGIVKRLAAPEATRQAGHPFTVATKLAGGRDAFVLSAWSPLEALELAMSRRANWTVRAAPGGRLPRGQQFTHELGEVTRPTARTSISTVLRRDGEAVMLTTYVPLSVLQELVQAALGISSGNPPKPRK